MKFFNSLTTRMFAIFWLTLALVLLLVVFLPSLDTRRITSVPKMEQQQIYKIQKTLETQLVLLSPKKQESLFRSMLFKEQTKWQNLRLVYVNPRQTHLSMHNNKTELRDIRSFIARNDDDNQPKRQRYERIEISGPFIAKGTDTNFLFYVVRPPQNRQSRFVSILFDYPIFMVAITMLISTPFLLWLAWSLAKPARRLRDAADAVAKGNLHQYPNLESGPMEFSEIGKSFNRMLLELENMVAKQRRLISDISHELRTPLTRLQLASALMRRKNTETPELVRIETEALLLEDMINNLLQLFQYQQETQISQERLDAQTLWSDVIENAIFESEQIDKQLKLIDTLPHCIILGNPTALKRVLENVIRNALKYSHHTVSLAFETEGSNLYLFIDDDGPGVPLSELEQIFNPFYRTDEARDRLSGGSGLGLAIVSEAVKSHHGTVHAEPSLLGGLRIVIQLPAVPYL